MPIFSTPISESLVRQSGTQSKFATVMHQDFEICTDAAEQVQAEFNEAMGTNIITNVSTYHDEFEGKTNPFKDYRLSPGYWALTRRCLHYSKQFTGAPVGVDAVC